MKRPPMLLVTNIGVSLLSSAAGNVGSCLLHCPVPPDTLSELLLGLAETCARRTIDSVNLKKYGKQIFVTNIDVMSQSKTANEKFQVESWTPKYKIQSLACPNQICKIKQISNHQSINFCCFKQQMSLLKAAQVKYLGGLYHTQLRTTLL